MTKCPICRQPATQKFGLKLFCGFEHAAEWAKRAQDKARAKKQAESRRQDREKLKSLKTRAEWLKDAQAIFNKYIRIRDAQKNCISCGGKLGAKYDAGHYRSCGAHPELRFQELNTHAQCVRCNQHLSGNLINYRKGLLIRIGQEKLDWLEGPHEPLKLTIPEIQALIAEYKAKIKQLV
jgi:hypothetical protein